MHTTLITLINRLDNSRVLDANVIQWGCPVPSFGDLSNSRVASLGLNPSNREFVDEFGNELEGSSRRFHTLRSLGLRAWSDVDARHLRMILESCRDYFASNPYDRWFNKLEQVISGTKASYYDTLDPACHLDLVPYATACKWTELTSKQRALLVAIAGDTLGLILRDSPVRLLILNGRSVVEQFQDIAGVNLDSQEMPSWSLPRQSRLNVSGVAYKGVIDTISGIRLRHKVVVLGYNHNLQSSFGVTTEVIQAIHSWIAQTSKEAVQ